MCKRSRSARRGVAVADAAARVLGKRRPAPAELQQASKAKHPPAWWRSGSQSFHQHLQQQSSSSFLGGGGWCVVPRAARVALPLDQHRLPAPAPCTSSLHRLPGILKPPAIPACLVDEHDEDRSADIACPGLESMARCGQVVAIGPGGVTVEAAVAPLWQLADAGGGRTAERCELKPADCTARTAPAQLASPPRRSAVWRGQRRCRAKTPVNPCCRPPVAAKALRAAA